MLGSSESVLSTALLIGIVAVPMKIQFPVKFKVCFALLCP